MKPVRLLTLGSIPPELGGATRGGVATFHATLIEELAGRAEAYGVELVGVLPFNFDPESTGQGPVPLLVPPREGDQAFYQEALERTGADVVLFLHIAQRWARFHARLGSPVPAVGSIRSWVAMARPGRPRESARHGIEEAMGGLVSIIFASSWCLETGRTLGFRYPVPTHVIPNHLPHRFLDPGIDVSGPRRGVLFVGLLAAHKNPGSLIAAAAAMPELSVTFVGDGEERASLEEQAVERGVGDRVRFTGSVSNQEVLEYLLSAELLCLPSRMEGFGNVYLEALACGSPIVGVGALVREIEGRLGVPCGEGLSVSDDIEVTAAIERVRHHAWDRTELRRRALAAFSPADVTGRYTEILREAAASA